MNFFEQNGLSPDSLDVFKVDRANLRSALVRQTSRVVVVGLADLEFVLSNYLREEGYHVTTATLQDAFETIRWQQPDIALVDGGLHGESSHELLRRLKADVLTRDIKVVIRVIEPLTEHYNHSYDKAVFVDNLKDLCAALRDSAKPAPLPTSKASAKPLFFPPVKDEQSADLPMLLANARLRHFVDAVIDSWPTLLLAGWLGQETDALVNVEMLCYQFDLCLEESCRAISRLAQVGYIEPLEFDSADPLFGLVVNHEQEALVTEFGAALKIPAYRMALATLILARERSVH